MGGACSRYWGEEKCMQILVGIHEGKRPLCRTRHRWEDYIKMKHQEIRLRKVAQDSEKFRAVVNSVINRQVP